MSNEEDRTGEVLRGAVGRDSDPDRRFVLDPSRDAYAATAMFVYCRAAGMEPMDRRRAFVLGRERTIPSKEGMNVHTFSPESFENLLKSYANQVGGDAGAGFMEAVLKRIADDFIEPVAFVGRTPIQRQTLSKYLEAESE